MRIRGVEVVNWGCIASLHLPELPDGVVVLHAPNGTGKSSLVRALRSGLFDHEHNSRDADLRAATNWRTQATPRVVVEFELPAGRYRILKVFSSRKEGEARLDEQTPRGWSTIARGKEASQRVRELIGVDRSDAGLFQLLWMTQGEVALPDKINGRLAQAVEEVLGSLVTPRDLALKAKLDEECERWFTARMADKTRSPLLDLKTRLDEARRDKEAVEQELNRVEKTLADHESARAEQPKLEKEVDEAEVELLRLRAQGELVRARQTRHQLALQAAEHARQRLDQAEAQLKDALARQDTWQNAQKKLEELKGLHALAAATRDIETARRDDAATKLKQAQEALTRHRQGLAELEEKFRWLELAGRIQRLADDCQRHAELTDAVTQLQRRLTTSPELSDKEIGELRRNRHEAMRLQARLEAAELVLSFEPERLLRVETAVDQSPPESRNLEPGTPLEAHIRQRVELRIEGAGTLRVSRREADSSLEADARQLNELQQAYAEGLRALSLEPATTVDDLAALRVERQGVVKERERLQGELQRLAPDAEQKTLHHQRTDFLARHPDWADWVPAAEDLTCDREEFNRCLLQLEQVVVDDENQLQTLQSASRKAETTLQDLERKLERLEGEVGTLRDEVARLDLVALQEARETARQVLAKCQRESDDSTLTPEEEQLRQRHEALEEALTARRTAREQNRLLLHGLQVQLRGTEGLHQKRIQAEQAVNELAAAYRREELTAKAHRRLKEAFEKIRNQQVGHTVGPIRDRVLDWARCLGLEEYTDLDFGAKLLPSGLRLASLGNEQPSIPIAQESHGTIEQLGLLVRLAVGSLLAGDGGAVAVLDDSLTHTDPERHQRMLEVLRQAAAGNASCRPPAGPLQLLVFTCHPDRYQMPEAHAVDLDRLVQRHR